MPLRALLLVLGSACLAVAGASGAGSASPPNGLTQAGRTVWNLEALLHDMFGAKQVWLRYLRGAVPRAVWDFSTAETALCRGGTWEYTFANARGSSFSSRRPSSPPKAELGASGGDIPLTVRHAYISCAHGRWLFIHIGNGPREQVADLPSVAAGRLSRREA